MAQAFDSDDSPAEVVFERSTPAITNTFIDSIYSKLSPIYDALFGAVLQPGRIAAVTQMGDAAGTRVLEVGTGIGTRLYPRSFQVTGIDLCSRMLENARKRIAREGLQHITLKRMDAASLEMDANSFDIVYAPYIISVVPDPVGVAREMRRVCRPGGRVVILNHFRSKSPIAAASATSFIGGADTNAAQDAAHSHQVVPSDVALRVKALESVLVEKGMIESADLDAVVETYTYHSCANGGSLGSYSIGGKPCIPPMSCMPFTAVLPVEMPLWRPPPSNRV